MDVTLGDVVLFGGVEEFKDSSVHEWSSYGNEFMSVRTFI